MILEISLFSAFNIIAAVIYTFIVEYKNSEENNDDGPTQQNTVPRNQLFSTLRVPASSITDAVNVYVIPVTHFRGANIEGTGELNHSPVDPQFVGLIVIPESDNSSTDSSDDDAIQFVEIIDDDNHASNQNTIQESVAGHSNVDNLRVSGRETFMLWRRAANILQTRTGGLHRVATELMELTEVSASDNSSRDHVGPEGYLM